MQKFEADIKIFQSEAVQRFLLSRDEKLIQKQTADIQRIVRQQIELRQKAAAKLPSWINAGAYLPSRTALEQATSERVAVFKASMFRGKRMLNLTGGLGADDWAFSTSFDEIISLDISADLNASARLNFEKLKRANIERFTISAEEWVGQNQHEKFALIYADPDRRTAGKRSALWDDASPNMEKLLPVLLEMATEVWVKSSPLTNPDEFRRKFGRRVLPLVIEENGEVKEILYRFSNSHFQSATMAAIISENGAEVIDSANLEHENPALMAAYGRYVFEPSPAIIKAGMARTYAASKHLSEVTRGNYWFTADKVPDNFSGRVFQVIEQMPYKPRLIKAWLKEKKITRAMVAKRFFPHPVAEIRKTLKLADGGEDFLLFTEDGIGLKMLVVSMV